MDYKNIKFSLLEQSIKIESVWNLIFPQLIRADFVLSFRNCLGTLKEDNQAQTAN